MLDSALDANGTATSSKRAPHAPRCRSESTIAVLVKLVRKVAVLVVVVIVYSHTRERRGERSVSE